MNTELVLQVIAALVVGLGAGYVGSLMVLRRMSLVGDALSHIALPGLAVALLIGINPLWGAFTVLAAAVLGVWYLQEHTELPTETLVGIFFTTSLAIGLLLTPEHELLEALFGDISTVGTTDILIACVAVFVVATLLMRITRPLVLSTISSDLARAHGIDTRKIHFLFLLTVAIVVGLGIKVTGTVLTGALVIIPAAAARNIATSLTRYTLASAFLGALAGVIGVTASWTLGYAAGPLIILAGGIMFAATLPFRR